MSRHHDPGQQITSKSGRLVGTKPPQSRQECYRDPIVLAHHLLFLGTSKNQEFHIYKSLQKNALRRQKV